MPPGSLPLPPRGGTLRPIFIVRFILRFLRRCKVDSAFLKSGRCLTGIVSEPTKFERIHQLPRKTSRSSSMAIWVWSSFASLSISRITYSERPNSSIVFLKPCITDKLIVNVHVLFLSTLLLELICRVVFFATFFLPVPVTV